MGKKTVITEEMKQARRWNNFCAFWAQLARIVTEQQKATQPTGTRRHGKRGGKWKAPRYNW